MDQVHHLTPLVTRQYGVDAQVECSTTNDYDGRMGLRIAAIFVVWFGSTMGACFPIFAHRHKGVGVPSWAFFVAKFFGSGVIIGTAFIHLLSPAEQALRNPCLTGGITEYDWVSGIILMTVFAMFIVELMVMRKTHAVVPTTHTHGAAVASATDSGDDVEVSAKYKDVESPPRLNAHQPGVDHLSHHDRHNSITQAHDPFSFEDYKSQLTAIFILEFGIIFHSVFIGLTLAVAGAEFITLFIVLTFHQTFEGLGLGSRLAIAPWPARKRWTPYILGVAYGLSTPIAIAAGLGVRTTYPPGSATTLIVNGVFDSISAGILIYTGLVELMAHEFMFSRTMLSAPMKTVASAVGFMCLGAGLMALLGKWA